MAYSQIAVLVVEDEALVRMGIVDFLEDHNFEVFEAEDADAAIMILKSTARIGALLRISICRGIWMAWRSQRPFGTDGRQSKSSSRRDIERLPLETFPSRHAFSRSHTIRTWWPRRYGISQGVAYISPGVRS